jgi:hypothetical protein
MEEFQMTLKVRWGDLGDGDVGGGLSECLQEACQMVVRRKYTPPVEADVQWGGEIRGSIVILPLKQVEAEEEALTYVVEQLVPALRAQVATLEVELLQAQQSGRQHEPGCKDGTDL